MFPEFSAEQWQQIETWFFAASELNGEARDRFLAQIPDQDLQQYVRNLLQTEPSAAGHIAQIIEGAAQIASPESEWVGRRFGPYRIVREVGRGGMGAVFEAVRDDSEYRLRVALKVAHTFHDTDSFKERFRQERQILAALQHPFIARFLDGGTEQGLPYFVMEFVEGIPVTAFCDENKLGVRERIELFRRICSAVDHAHSHLVIHRDLKPGNILVTSDGTPKLVDFGIAKLRETQVAGGETTGAQLWTPDYASPEQVRSELVTTRSDTYSLGLILYELLCGHKAQEADRSSPLALDRSICDTEPVPPSVRATEHGVRKTAAALSGDLDAIILRAIRKEPSQRFDSAAALSEDLRRYLDGEPVLSRPASLWYRSRKLIRRHRLSFTSAALVMVSLVGGIIATSYQARLASQRFEHVREMSRALMFDIHDAIRPLSGSVRAQHLVVTTALRYLDALALTASDRGLQLEIAAGYDRIGSIQGDSLNPSLGEREQALGSYRKALAILAAMPAGIEDNKAKSLLATVHFHIGRQLQDGTAAAEGKKHIEKAIAILEPAVAAPHDDKAIDRTLAQAYVSYASAGRTGGDLKRNLDGSLRAIALLEPIAAKAAPSSAVHYELATALSIAGAVYFQSVRVTQAVPYFEKAVLSFEKILEANPSDSQVRRSVMLAHSKVGDAYWGTDGYSLGDRQKALPSYRKMLEQAEWMHERDKANISVRIDYAIALMRFGDVLEEKDTRAVELLSRALRLIDAILAKNSRDSRLTRNQMDLCLRLAKRQLASGNRDAALATLRHGAAAGEGIARMDGSNALIIAWLLRIHLATVREHANRKEHHPALQEVRKAVTVAKRLSTIDPTHPNSMAQVARTYALAADVHSAAGDENRAAELHLQSLATWKQVTGLANLPRNIAEEAARADGQ